MILYIFLSVVFITIFLLLRSGNTRFSPVRVWTFMWAASFGFHAIFGGVYYFSPLIILVVAIGGISYIFGALVFWISNRSIKPISKTTAENFRKYLSRSRSVQAGILFGNLLLLPIMELGVRNYSGSSLSKFFSAPTARIMVTMRENHSVLSQAHVLNFPTEFKIATMMIVILAVFSFYRISFERPRLSDMLNVALLIVISLLLSAVTSVRSMILIPIIVGSFSFFAGCVLNYRTHVLVSKKVIFGSISVIILFSVWVVFIQSARLGDVTISRLGATLAHLRPWVAGYIPALSVWAEGLGSAPLMGGQFFFGGFLGPLGLGGGEGFSARLVHADIGNYQYSNAMTIYRVFILDFGMVGAMIFPFFLGWLGEFFFQRSLRNGGGWIPILIAQYCWTFFSVNYWFFFYGARVFGMIFVVFSFSLIWTLVRSRK